MFLWNLLSYLLTSPCILVAKIDSLILSFCQPNKKKGSWIFMKIFVLEGLSETKQIMLIMLKKNKESVSSISLFKDVDKVR